MLCGCFDEVCVHVAVVVCRSRRHGIAGRASGVIALPRVGNPGLGSHINPRRQPHTVRQCEYSAMLGAMLGAAFRNVFARVPALLLLPPALQPCSKTPSVFSPKSHHPPGLSAATTQTALVSHSSPTVFPVALNLKSTHDLQAIVFWTPKSI